MHAMRQPERTLRHWAPITPASAALADIVTTWADIRTSAAAQMPVTHRYIPRPGAVLSFQYGDRLTLSLANVAATRRSYLVGPASVSPLITAGGDVRAVTVTLSPWGAARLLAMPMHALCNQHVDLADLFGAVAVGDIEARLDDAVDATARWTIVSDFLLARLSTRPAPAATALPLKAIYAIILASGGTLPVTALCNAAESSPRQLERQFLATIGLSPKVVSRLVRLQHALALFEQGLPWTAIAFEAGLCDQAHLIREFHSLMGIPPGAMRTADSRRGLAIAMLDERVLRLGLAPASYISCPQS